MNIDISNAHCGPRIQFLDHAWLRVVITYKRLLASVLRITSSPSRRFRRCNAFRSRVDDTREIRDVRAKVGPFVGVCNGSRENREACTLSRARTRKREANVMNDRAGTRVRAFTALCVVVLQRPPVCCTAPWITHSGLSARTGVVEFAFTSRARSFTVLPTSPEMKNLSRERESRER